MRKPTRSVALLACALGAALLVGAPAQAQRAVDDPTVTVKPGLVITGSGFGHGHGLSQYGAQGGAQLGRTAAQILAFYYPGTTPSKTSQNIRVLISRDTDHNTVVLAERGLKLTDMGRHTTWTLPTGKRAWRLSTVAGATRVYFKTTTWHPYKPGGHLTLTGIGQFSSAASALTLRTPSGDKRYRGRMRLVNGNTVNVLTLDNYVRGVIPSEMPTSWLPAALQAQAIAARTYAAYEMAHFAARSYQVCDTSACQVYGGLSVETANSNAAEVGTAGQILTYGGAPAFTQFSASDGGWTAAGDFPYLPYQKDPWDQAYRNWTKPLDVTAVQHAYPTKGALLSIRLSRPVTYANGGRVSSVLLTFANGPVTVTGPEAARALFGLRSSLFTFQTP